MYKIDSLQKSEYPTLLDIWESSVKATHHFLKDGDIDVLKKIIVENDIFSLADLACVRDNNNCIVGFMGTSENSLEMLFISPDVMKKGIGKMLMLHAINNLHIAKVDVNEQNEQAVKFYEQFGFQTISRSELDSTTGKPYPILHMERR
jgi:putative acetyltransferase